MTSIVHVEKKMNQLIKQYANKVIWHEESTRLSENGYPLETIKKLKLDNINK